MGREDFETVRQGVVKRRTHRRIGLFVNGVGLDLATKRLSRKVEIKSLISGLVAGGQVEVARYYTIVPYVDDARQIAFLDAVGRGGLEVISKRLPPKGVTRQVSIDVPMATDVTAFCFGRFAATESGSTGRDEAKQSEEIAVPIKREAIIVCPDRELSYAILSAHENGTVTSLADFGLYGKSDSWPGVDKWIDLSTSETIWRE